MGNNTSALAIPQAANAPRLFLNLPVEVAQLPIRPAAKLVYGALKMHCRHREVCRVRWATLQAETGLSRASVGRALSDLKQAHLVGTLRTGRSSYYAIYPPTPDDDAPDTAHSRRRTSAAMGRTTEPEDSSAGALPARPPATGASNSESQNREAPVAPPLATVENSAKSQVDHFHKRDFAEASTSTSEPTCTPSTGPTRAGTVGKTQSNPISSGGPTNRNQNRPKTAPVASLLTFLAAPVREGGLGWKLHRGNSERVAAFVTQVGLKAATQSAYRCFDQGQAGGAALWDWSLSQAGFRRRGAT